ncbi:unnamed protein product [Timema podura]|uniref:Uncharacterized protein n=1 Tax=Timema podura TaxID=61482 RepID=A0ABN7NMT2_TIMPD|nr:unnamed protein product [Timema podura]
MAPNCLSLHSLHQRYNTPSPFGHPLSRPQSLAFCKHLYSPPLILNKGQEHFKLLSRQIICLPTLQLLRAAIKILADNLTLSPLPLGKSLSMSPCRRISERHNVVIRSLENISTPLSPNTPEPLSYRFSRSPAKDLKAINAMIQIDTRKINKRLLVDDTADDDAPPVKRPTPVVAKKLQNLIGDRLGQTQD